jgi:ParB-like chromosome segregation protein Spo0J
MSALNALNALDPTLNALLLPLSQLRANVKFQPRFAGLDAEHLERLRASELRAWPPLVVSPNTIGTYDVVDGFHRLHVARERGLEAIACTVVESAGYPEAVEANLAHGLPLTLADRKAYARWLYDDDPTRSFAEIGRQSGLSDKTAKKAVLGTEAEPDETHDDASEFPSQASDVAADGPDPVERLVQFAAAAIGEGTGVNRFAQFFSQKTDAQQRAEYVQRVIAHYRPEDQPRLAAALILCGTALIEGARLQTPAPR